MGKREKERIISGKERKGKKNWKREKERNKRNKNRQQHKKSKWNSKIKNTRRYWKFSTWSNSKKSDQRIKYQNFYFQNPFLVKPRHFQLPIFFLKNLICYGVLFFWEIKIHLEVNHLFSQQNGEETKCRKMWVHVLVESQNLNSVFKVKSFYQFPIYL